MPAAADAGGCFPLLGAQRRRTAPGSFRSLQQQIKTVSGPIQTLGQLFLASVARDKSDYILFRREGKFRPISAKEFLRRVVRLHLGLRSLGIAPGDRCALLSENRWEWAAADFAMMTAGVVSVPLYPSLPPEQLHYMLENSEARAIFTSNEAQWSKIEAIRRRLPALDSIIRMDGQPGGPGSRVFPFGQFISPGPLTAEEGKKFENAIASVQPEDLASIIYTSGTTGTPKGVMLTHRNLVSNVLDAEPDLGPRDVALSFLPLCHIYQRMVDYACYLHGVTVAHVDPIAEVPEALEKVRPTVLSAVPRFYEKLYRRIKETADAAPAPRRQLFRWAVETGFESVSYRLEGRPMPLGLRLRFALADRLVFSKIRRRLGGRVRLLTSGGAALPRQVAEFFYAVNLPILEGYGLTETSPLIAASRPERMRFGTVGKPIRNVEVRIAEDGEILVRGPNVMRGYYKMDQETAEALADGWFHTGDIGSFDADGFLTVIDRKKDLLKTSGGKYIAPQPIENRLRNQPYIADAVVIADNRRFPSALIVPDFDRLGHYAREHGIADNSPSDLAKNPKIVALLEQQVAEACASLAHFEQIKKIAVLDHEFSLAAGEMTPTMKVRRREVERRYKDEIEKLYEEAAVP
jgi:long-chain acyl-CoA synthetase